MTNALDAGSFDSTSTVSVALSFAAQFFDTSLPSASGIGFALKRLSCPRFPRGDEAGGCMNCVRLDVRFWRWIWLAPFIMVVGSWALSYRWVVWAADKKFDQVVHFVNGRLTWHYATTSPLPGFGILAGANVTPPADVFVWH